MKKTIVLLLTLLTLCTVALADEITFRNIPWGSNIEEVQSLLIKDMAIWEEWSFSPKDAWMPYSEAMTSEYILDLCSTSENCGYNYEPRPYKQNIAGHRLTSLSLYAHYGENTNGISKEPVDTVFYAAEYTLAVDSDIEAAYDELQGKLSYLYGTCESAEVWNSSSLYREGQYTCMSTWYGDNATAVTLYCEYPVQESYRNHCYIKLRYYKTDCDEKLDIIKVAVEQMNLAAQYKDSNLSGL